MNKVIIYKTYRYGGWYLQFKKEFELPFVPQIGIHIIDEYINQKGEVEYDHIVDFLNNDYYTTDIFYHTSKKYFEVNISYRLPNGCDPNELDSILEQYDRFEWERVDTTNIESFKDLLNKNI